MGAPCFFLPLKKVMLPSSPAYNVPDKPAKEGMPMNPQNRPHPLARPLTEEDVLRSRREHGANTLSQKRRKSFLSRFLGNLNDPVIRILLGALVIQILFSVTGEGGDWAETAGIALAVFLATLISTLSEHGSEAAFARLSAACGQATCRVRRRRSEGDGEGDVTEIPLSEAVVGDVVVELKSVDELISAHRAQLFNYLRLTKQPVGLLINFGQSSLQGERYGYDEESNECILLDKNMCPVYD